MNIVDIIVLVLIGVSILMGVYKGFLYSVLNIGSFLLSGLIALLFYPIMARNVINGDLFPTILNYADGAQRISDVSLVHTPIASLSESQISAAISEAGFPSPIGSLLERNISSRAFESAGLTTLGEYFNQTAAVVLTNIACFLIIFLIVRIVLLVVLNGANYVLKFPMLKQYDLLVGGCCGLVNGILLMFAVFMLVPIAFTLLPYDSITSIVETSVFGNFFYQCNFLLPLIGGA